MNGTRSAISATSARASSRVGQSGFWHMMAMPRSAAARQIPAWNSIGAAMSTASSATASSMAPASGNTAGISNAAARSRAASSDGSAMATTSAPGQRRHAARWYRLIMPAPIMPIRKGDDVVMAMPSSLEESRSRSRPPGNPRAGRRPRPDARPGGQGGVTTAASFF